eukprot:m.33227 g.33227  ORF g.33227 m.33227 type:complete len:224 (+) comp9601_c0_seq2:480-1151(+)
MVGLSKLVMANLLTAHTATTFLRYHHHHHYHHPIPHYSLYFQATHIASMDEDRLDGIDDVDVAGQEEAVDDQVEDALGIEAEGVDDADADAVGSEVVEQQTSAAVDDEGDTNAAEQSVEQQEVDQADLVEEEEEEQQQQGVEGADGKSMARDGVAEDALDGEGGDQAADVGADGEDEGSRRYKYLHPYVHVPVCPGVHCFGIHTAHGFGREQQCVVTPVSSYC